MKDKRQPYRDWTHTKEHLENAIKSIDAHNEGSARMSISLALGIAHNSIAREAKDEDLRGLREQQPDAV